MDVVFEEFLIEWLVVNYKNFGVILEFIIDKFLEGV